MKIAKISDIHFFYENNPKLSDYSKIKKGAHFIRYYSRLFGGSRDDWIETINKMEIELKFFFKRYSNT
jgi:hypothetical protein